MYLGPQTNLLSGRARQVFTRPTVKALSSLWKFAGEAFRSIVKLDPGPSGPPRERSDQAVGPSDFGEKLINRLI